MQVPIEFPHTLSAEDIEFLKAVAAIIGDCQFRCGVIGQQLNGARAYANNLNGEQLEAAHISLNRYIADRSGRGY